MIHEKQIASQAIGYFLKYYNITNDQGEPLDFIDHAYLKQIYADFTPKQAVLKAAQIGFSTTANIKAFWLAKNKGMDIIYSLPSASDIKDFVSGKTNRLVDNNRIFQQWTIDKDSIEQKRIGNNVIYFKGTWTERAAIATPADLYISDETDRSKQDIVRQFKTRLQHSKYAWEWYFSNPSVTGQGVDAYYQLSDQKHWFVQCDACNKWQFLTFEHIKGNIFACDKCGKELNRRKGEWIKKYQDREISGYWIPSFVNPKLSAEWILAKQKEMSEEQFTNFILGKPYLSRGNTLTGQMFLQNLTAITNPQDARPIIGVDTGNEIKFEVGNKYGIFYYDKANNYNPIRSMLTRWPNAIAVIDQGGDIIEPRKLREEFPGRIFLCYFKSSQRNDNLIEWNNEKGTVVADRDRLIQLCIDEFVEKRCPVYGTEAEWYDYMREWIGMRRTTEEDVLGVTRYHWEKPAVGRCDWPFAHVYWRIGMDRFLENSVTFHDPNKTDFAFDGMEMKPQFDPKQ